MYLKTQNFTLYSKQMFKCPSQFLITRFQRIAGTNRHAWLLHERPAEIPHYCLESSRILQRQHLLRAHLPLHQAECKLPPGLSQTCENLELPHNLCQRTLSFHLYGPYSVPFLQQQKQHLARPQLGKSPTRIRNGCLKPLEISFMDTLLQERNAIN